MSRPLPFCHGAGENRPLAGGLKPTRDFGFSIHLVALTSPSAMAVSCDAALGPMAVVGGRNGLGVAQEPIEVLWPRRDARSASLAGCGSPAFLTPRLSAYRGGRATHIQIHDKDAGCPSPTDPAGRNGLPKDDELADVAGGWNHAADRRPVLEASEAVRQAQDRAFCAQHVELIAVGAAVVAD